MNALKKTGKHTFRTDMKMEGRYKLARVKASGEVVQETDWIDNVITNVGKNQFLTITGGAAFHPVVGTGNTVPAVTDTVLASFLAGVSNASGGQNFVQVKNFASTPYYMRLTIKNRFGLGVAAGNISEIGMHCSNSISTTPNGSSQLFSRALVRDGAGDPTVVVVLSDEYLDVTWELTIYIAASVTGTVPQGIKGVNTTPAYVMTPACVDSSSALDGGWALSSSSSGTGSLYVTFPAPFFSISSSSSRTRLFPGTTAQPAINAIASNGTSSFNNNASNATSASYTNGTFYRDFTYNWGLNYGNGNTIRCFKLDITMGVLWLYYTDSSSFNKANTDVLDVTIRITVS